MRKKAVRIPIRPDHIYTEWVGNGRCYYCNREYENHDFKSARLIYAPVAYWQAT